MKSKFCFICKRLIEYKKVEEFFESGHSDEKVPFLAPDYGRTSSRYERAIKNKK